MGNLTTAFVITISINVMMFLGQVSILEMNPDAPIYFTLKGTMLGDLDKSGGVIGGNYTLDDSDPASRIPSGAGGISPTTGNLFTDTFRSIKSWLFESTGASYLVAILSAPYNFLKALHLPNAFVFAVGSMWYGISLLLLILFLTGREG